MKRKLTIIMTILAAAFVASSCSQPVPQPAPTGGDYGPVPASRFRGKHLVFATGTSGDKFIWEFSGDRFKISGDDGPIPGDAVFTILGKGQVAKAIDGRWTVDEQGLTLTGITADGKDGYKNVTLRPFQTPVVRVDLNGTQYVFRQLP